MFDSQTSQFVGFLHSDLLQGGDSCPWIRAKNRADWAIPDPKHLPPEEFNAVRDTIRAKVSAMLEVLRTNSN